MPNRIAPARLGRTRYRLNSLVMATMLWHPIAAHAAAEDPGASMFAFSAFGTLGVVHSSEDRADFTQDIFEANGPAIRGHGALAWIAWSADRLWRPSRRN